MAVDNTNLVYLLDPAFQIENLNGKPLVGGHLEVYLAGTNTKYITAQDWDGTENPFEIPLSMDGRAIVLVEADNAYDLYVYDSFNNQIFSRPNIRPTKGDGLSEVFHDWSLKGKGTKASPLGVKRYKNLAVDETLTAYEGTVKGKNSLIIGINQPWLSANLALNEGGFVTNQYFSSYSALVESNLSNKVDTSDLTGYMTTGTLYDTFLTKSTFNSEISSYYQRTETSSKDELSNAFGQIIRDNNGSLAYASVPNSTTSFSSIGFHKQIYSPSSCLLVGADNQGVSSWLGYTMPDSWTNVKNELGNPEERIFYHSLLNDSSNTNRATGIELPTNSAGAKPKEVYGSVRVGISQGNKFSIVAASSLYHTYTSGGEEVIDEHKVDIVQPSLSFNFRNVVPNTENTYNFAFTGNNLHSVCIKDGSSAINVSATNWAIHCKW